MGRGAIQKAMLASGGDPGFGSRVVPSYLSPTFYKQGVWWLVRHGWFVVGGSFVDQTHTHTTQHTHTHTHTHTHEIFVFCAGS